MEKMSSKMKINVSSRTSFIDTFIPYWSDTVDMLMEYRNLEEIPSKEVFLSVWDKAMMSVEAFDQYRDVVRRVIDVVLTALQFAFDDNQGVIKQCFYDNYHFEDYDGIATPVPVTDFLYDFLTD